MRRNIRVNLKPIQQQPNNATALGGPLIVCPICGNPANTMVYWGIAY